MTSSQFWTALAVVAIDFLARTGKIAFAISSWPNAFGCGSPGIAHNCSGGWPSSAGSRSTYA